MAAAIKTSTLKAQRENKSVIKFKTENMPDYERDIPFYKHFFQQFFSFCILCVFVFFKKLGFWPDSTPVA